MIFMSTKHPVHATKDSGNIDVYTKQETSRPESSAV